MKRILPLLLFALTISLTANSESADPDVSAIVAKVTERIRENVAALQQYGYFQDVTTMYLQKDGALKKQDTLTYRTVWIQDKRFHELVERSDRKLTPSEIQKEQKRRAEFMKALETNSQPKGALNELKMIRWWELYKKYDFDLLPPDQGARYLLSFKPKQGDLLERSRFEKVLNHLTGKIWIDEGYNVVKAQANLLCPVKFGWGLIGKVLKSEVEYIQREHQQAWLPDSVTVQFKMQAALFHTENRNIQVRWYEPYTRDTSLAHTAVQRAKTGLK